MSTGKYREIHLASYPEQAPGPENFRMVERDIPEPAEGQALLRQIWMSVDPYMRGRMRAGGRSYAEPFALDEPLKGGAVGRVVKSRNPKLPVGAYAVGMNGGWREYYLSDGSDLQIVDPSAAPLSAYLGALGMPGLTAWHGVANILKPEAGETVLVSAAAGAVGSIVCQLAKRRGARVVGVAGGEEKRRWLEDEAGIDAAIDYKAAGDGLSKAVAAAAPEGVDAVFENVGGAQLEAALDRINDFGRIALCGLISVYNDPRAPTGPRNFINILTRRVRLQGFIITDHWGEYPRFIAEVAPLVKAGEIALRETIYEGLERAPEAFLGLFSGANTGKAVVRLCEDEAPVD